MSSPTSTSPPRSPLLRSIVRPLLRLLVAVLWAALRLLAQYVVTPLSHALHSPARPTSDYTAAATTSQGHPHAIAAGKTVLVTTGRQAKTLHVVRALKRAGATVVVTDYDGVSPSAVSAACDHFVQLPPLDALPPHDWVRAFRLVLEHYAVDVVVPVSTINEVLVLGLAKSTLQHDMPNVQWLCPDLDQALMLDDRARFSQCCQRARIPVPDSGVLNSTDGIEAIATRFRHGIILKRMESSVNRGEEIVPLLPATSVPAFVQPSEEDPWQWQQFITGVEKSVWYICIDGAVTFRGCYHSEADLTHFDAAPTPPVLDRSLKTLIAQMRLTGQFAFDFIEDAHGNPFVIECNPRSSSILETVSETPGWGDAFFGVDVTERTVTSSVGFLFHRNSFPWEPRADGHFKFWDPLPFLAAQVIWPLHAIVEKGLTEKSFEKIDVNICKIIVKGLSPPRNLKFFYEQLVLRNLEFAKHSIEVVECLLLDISLPGAKEISRIVTSRGHKVFPLATCVTSHIENEWPDVEIVGKNNLTDAFFGRFAKGETRALLGVRLSKLMGSNSPVSYWLVSRTRTTHPSSELPLRRKRVLHLIGSSTSNLYQGVSAYYGFSCLDHIASDERYEHIVAYIHLNGEWSIGQGRSRDYLECDAERISIGAAIQRLERVAPDVVHSHLFDYLGLTAFRMLFDVLQIPGIGCTGEALALSTNKVRTKAVLRNAGVKVADCEVLYKKTRPTISPPFVMKPSEEDNSLGITLVKTEDEVDAALDEAFSFGDEIMCEKFIALGRELRVAVIEDVNGDLDMLPVLEYEFDEGKQIRGCADKLDFDKQSGSVKAVSTTMGRKLPAVIDDELHARLFDLASKSHRALGCRDYSLYDVRVDTDGVPFTLESCLYCSFGPRSVISSMCEAKGLSSRVVFERMVDWAIGRRHVQVNNEVQKGGMKVQR